jgi:hypothetical protein
VVGGLPNPYVFSSVDLTSLLTAGNTYTISFLESDSTGPINVGLDDVSLVATPLAATPEPKLLAFPLAFLVGIIALRARRKAQLN